MIVTSGFWRAAGPTSRGDAARWSNPVRANPLCTAKSLGMLNSSPTFFTCSRKAMPMSSSRNQPDAYGTSPQAV